MLGAIAGDILGSVHEFKPIKTKDFEFNWKEFFVKDTEINEIGKTYTYTNLVKERDPIEWGFKTIFYGRSSKKYKFHPELLNEKLIAK